MFGPVILKGKILIQDLWKIKDLDWDDQVSTDIINQWKEYHSNVMDLSTQSIPRWIGADNNCKMQWHIFTDASEAAIGAAVFLRTVNPDGTIVSRLMTSKSKVAPIKKSTIPRLELMAAHLGSKLAAYVIRACQLANIEVFFWSDSTIVIHWLNKDPALLKQYVCNRVSSILGTTATLKGKWQHISGTENPADLISRGLTTKELFASTLWWNGPSWLLMPQNEWPHPVVSALSAKELEAENKEAKSVFVGVIELSPANCLWGEGPNHSRIPLVERFSTLNSTLRVTALVLRFLKNVKARISIRKTQLGTVNSPTLSSNITDVYTPSPTERELALRYWIGIAQKCHFGPELRAIKKGIELASNSPLRHFAPFIDDNGMLRVGGRLKNSDAAFEQKHHIIVPRESTIGKLIIRSAHYSTMHGGLSVNKAFLRQRFWFPRIGMAIRQYTHRCPTCIRYSKSAGEQIMGQLPSVRVAVSEPFSRVGVDFAGPFLLRKSAAKILPLRKAAQTQYREPATIKGWIVVYVCLVTRAVHLDVTTGLTVEEFLETFAKMTSRRGLCCEIWSDNGTTFVGANREMARVLKEWDNQVPSQQLASLGTTWRFITPSAPFQGGIWEAGVKSVKHHLKRVVGKRILTHGQMYTILTQIEAILNSKPLWPASDDPLDLLPITPAHLVIGRSTLQRPFTEDVSDRPDNRLTLWGLQQKIQQSFWQRWKEEYLNLMQKRVKWYKPKEYLKPGDMVIIMAENVPPTAWPLGRVIKVNQGQDGYVRSATIQTQSTSLERPIQKLCVLPSATHQQPLDV